MAKYNQQVLIGKRGEKFRVEDWQTIMTSELALELLGKRPTKSTNMFDTHSWLSQQADRQRVLDNIEVLRKYIFSQVKGLK